jgi:selenide,water dikinase
MLADSDAASALTGERLMLGFETADDAAVYRLGDNAAALLTVDFFTPIVDDPYDFGRITAANALSDIYAMGGRPLTALNLLAFPCSLGPDVVGQVLRGGAAVCAAADTLIVGGHTIDDAEPKYGLSVFGLVAPDRVLYNRGARPGDAIVLTKPLGTGLVGTALKRGVWADTDPHARTAIEQMATLNRAAAEALQALHDHAGEAAHAGTDVTGFGVAGHLHEMAAASGVSATLDVHALPLLSGVRELSADDVRPGRTADLIRWVAGFSEWDGRITAADRDVFQGIVCDPQTSGGLLLALPPKLARRYCGLVDGARIIGGFTPGPAGHILFV